MTLTEVIVGPDAVAVCRAYLAGCFEAGDDFETHVGSRVSNDPRQVVLTLIDAEVLQVVRFHSLLRIDCWVDETLGQENAQDLGQLVRGLLGRMEGTTQAGARCYRVWDGQPGLSDDPDPIGGKARYSLHVWVSFRGGVAADPVVEIDVPDWFHGTQGPPGADGADGADGEPGADGTDGVGVPAGGTTGQVLAKSSNADFDDEWVDPSGGGGSGLPAPWTADQVHGDVVATVNDPARVPITIEAIAGQSGSLLVAKDESGNVIWAIDPITGATPDIRAGFPFTVAEVTQTYEGNPVTYKAMFFDTDDFVPLAWALTGDANPRVCFVNDPEGGVLFLGDGTFEPYTDLLAGYIGWTSTHVVADGGEGAIRLGPNAQVDNTLHVANIELTGDFLGTLTVEPTDGLGKLLELIARSDQSVDIASITRTFAEASATDAPNGLVYVGGQTFGEPWQDNGITVTIVENGPSQAFAISEVGTDITIALATDGSENITTTTQALYDAIVAYAGGGGLITATQTSGFVGSDTAHYGTVFTLAGGMGPGSLRVKAAGNVALSAGDNALPTLTLSAISGQTASILEAKDETGNTITRLDASGAIGTSAGEPADGDILAGECFRWFDPTAGAPTVRFKGKDANGDVFTLTAPMTAA